MVMAEIAQSCQIGQLTAKWLTDFSCELSSLDILHIQSTYSAFPTGVPVSERSLAHAGLLHWCE